MNPAIVWFRDDFRMADHPALHAAAATRRPLVCLYIHEETRRLGGAARWWLHESLHSLQESLAKRAGALTILRGTSTDILPKLANSLGAAAIYWNRRYDGSGRALDSRIEALLTAQGVHVATFNGRLLNEPWALTNKAGKPFRVFTAYWRAVCAGDQPAPPLRAPRTLRFHRLSTHYKLQPVPLAELDLQPRAPDWAGGLRAQWEPSEPCAQARLRRFLRTALRDYPTDRDRPDRDGTSRLSPYLAFGNLSVRQVWHAARKAVASHSSPATQRQLEKFLAELGWREFNYHILYHHPDLAERNFQSRFDPLRWRKDARAMRAWQRGLTGYPLVDAGMRELWTTGWMHNRVRMVTASFLVKHLLIDWRNGERWFWDTLVDADPANNAANWQWVAGSGADAAPYFRIFNPTLQGEKFDPEGAYVRRWVPELAQLPAQLIHKPWKAKAAQLAAAGIRLGKTYPHPIVDHDRARTRALMNIKSLG
jgi:deoxyribodipyrimidine photo-lyase